MWGAETAAENIPQTSARTPGVLKACDPCRSMHDDTKIQSIHAGPALPVTQRIQFAEGLTPSSLCGIMQGWWYLPRFGIHRKACTMTVELHGFRSIPQDGDTDVNAMWRTFFALWWEEFGSQSVRVYQIAPLARKAGFEELVVPSRPDRVEHEGALPSFTQFGMLLQRKHRHVHNGLRLISDRKELGWSSKTTGSTYHLEPKDEPRGYKSAGFQSRIGESEE